ncbi:SUMF1/EgtB/PvdO family nonheme iron enzyme [Desulfovibrio sp. JC010]|uniref:SUMF1/EgtB/PvdO family nonheme iron enzyme n=1 Tax=Desulfovibrio sp. JC010 TaxID=2593641 RepID=UPI0013D41398|nr:SUMF1/EgtB/PvdO family nonheme iron enzyme [Desulfovibrio sp. JC010]
MNKTILLVLVGCLVLSGCSLSNLSFTQTGDKTRKSSVVRSDVTRRDLCQEVKRGDYSYKVSKDGYSKIEAVLFDESIQPAVIIPKLIEHGNDINAGNENGDTVLHLLARKTDSDRIRSLIKICLDNGADLTIKNNKGRSPLTEAFYSAHDNSPLKFLADSTFPYPQAEIDRLMYEYVQEDYTLDRIIRQEIVPSQAVLDEAIRLKSDRSAHSIIANTDLMVSKEDLAALYRRELKGGYGSAYYDVFVQRGVDINAVMTDRRLQLHQLVKRGDYPTIENLLKAGANPRVKNQQQQYPIELVPESAAKYYLPLARAVNDFEGYELAFKITGDKQDFVGMQKHARTKKQKEILEMYALDILKDKSKACSISLSVKSGETSNREEQGFFSKKDRIVKDYSLEYKVRENKKLGLKYGPYRVTLDLAIEWEETCGRRSEVLGDNDGVIKKQRSSKTVAVDMKGLNSLQSGKASFSVQQSSVSVGALGGSTQCVMSTNPVGRAVVTKIEAISPDLVRRYNSMKYLRTSEDTSVVKDKTTGMQFVRVPGGCYMMGDGKKEKQPVHKVCLDEFWIGKYEVTQAEWEKVMGNNPSISRGTTKPVNNVSWEDIKSYIRKLNAKGKTQYRLPTEAEWEYAARSGGKQERYAGGSDCERLAWYGGNSEGQVYTVGIKEPNGLGIYDMSGNVGEYCEDIYAEWAYGKHELNNPIYLGKGDLTGDYHALRGGSSYYGAWDLRTTSRALGKDGGEYTGFRLVRISPKELQ